MDITVDEGAVFEAAAGGSGFGSCDEALGEVDAGGVNLRVLLRESTGIEAGTAAEFEDVRAGSGAAGGKESAGNLVSVVAEEIFAAERVEPGAAFKEAVGRMRGRTCESSAGHFAVAWVHSVPCQGLNVVGMCASVELPVQPGMDHECFNFPAFSPLDALFRLWLRDGGVDFDRIGGRRAHGQFWAKRAPAKLLRNGSAVAPSNNNLLLDLVWIVSSY